jgi:sialic acid synthase SpsE
MAADMRFGPWDLEASVAVVAEIGNNHEGNVSLAETLIGLAAEAGADAVKFQTFKTERFVTSRDTERVARLRRFELTQGEFLHLRDVAAQHGIPFFATPLDLESLEFLAAFAPVIKIASGDSTFGPLLLRAAATRLPIILSTGATEMEEIANSVALIERTWASLRHTGLLALLHCVSSYPTAPDQANVAAISSLRAAFPYTVGYSDHTVGADGALLAVALGARIIEKHFTIDHNYSEFRDHQLSADPPELKELIERVRAAEVLLGDGEKRVMEAEREMVDIIRRSAAAARDLPAGHRITEADLMWVRPAGGIAPGNEQVVIGGRLRTPLSLGEIIDPVDVIT